MDKKAVIGVLILIWVCIILASISYLVPQDTASVWVETQLRNEQLNELRSLLAHIPPDPLTNRPLVMVSTSNTGFLDFTMNLFCSYKKVGIDFSRVLVVAFDEQAHEFCQARNISSFFYDASVARSSQTYGTNSYRKVTHAKTKVVYLLLSLGVDVFFVDGDLVLFDDPFQLFLDPEDVFLDIQYQCEYDFRENEPISSGCPKYVETARWLNTGFYIARSTPQTLHFYRTLLKEEEGDPETSEQLKAAEILEKFDQTGDVAWYDTSKKDKFYIRKPKKDYLDEKRPLRIRFLDAVLAANGAVYWKKYDSWKKSIAEMNRKEPVMVHANWMYRPDKKPSLQKAGFWYIDDQTLECIR